MYQVKENAYSILIAIIVGLFVVKIRQYFKKGKYPSGPVGLPFVGYLPFLKGDLHKSFFKLAKKYGPIFSLKMGRFDTVVINNFDGLKESGRKDEFAGRPPGVFHWSDTNTHIGNMNGKPWKEQRRFFSSTLRNVGMSRLKVEESMREQISLAVAALKASPRKTDVNVRGILGTATNNVIMSLICGKTYEPDDLRNQMLLSYQYKLLEYFHVIRTPYFLGFCYELYRKYSPKLRKITEELIVFENYIGEEIKEHKQNLDPDRKDDFMDFFLHDINKTPNPDSDSSFTMKSLLGQSQVMLMAGSETVRSTAEWTLLCLARHQLFQEQVYREIIEVLGPEKPPEWKDRERLILVQALILEVYRWKTPLAISDPHWTLGDVELFGYQIPKNTLILLNLWAIHNDETYWGDPENFRPERFLSDDFKSIVNAERMVVFGHGKRNCPGDKMAEVEIFLLVISIIQKLKILPPEMGVCMDEVTVLTQMVVKPVVRFESR